MLTPYSRSQFVTKILTSPSGEKFSVVFLVALVNGEVRAQVVFATPLSKPCVSCLPAPVVKKEVSFSYSPAFSSILSPFSSLFFYTSQPTRAPAFIK